MRSIFLTLSIATAAASGLHAGGAKENNAMAETDGLAWLTEDASGGLPEVNPLLVSGDVVTAGSSTVYPLAERMAERFEDEGYAGNLTIDSIGTGAGFERFTVSGETDIANASRPIKEAEREQAERIGRNPIEFRIGTDALAVTVSRENSFVSNVTLDELAALFSHAMTWREVRAEWPDEPILRFSPGTDSGTFDYFVEEIFERDPAALLSAENLQMSEDDNILAQGIKGSPYAIGYFGYAYFQENADTLRILRIEGVDATRDNIDDSSYPLARPLFLYSDARIMQSKPQVAAFLAFCLSFVNEEIVAAGYFPANPTALATAREEWVAAMGDVLE